MDREVCVLLLPLLMSWRTLRVAWAMVLLACGAPAEGDSQSQNDESAKAATISFAGVAFDPSNFATFNPAVTGSVRAGARLTIDYDAARLPRNGAPCAQGAPVRMGQKINRDPQRVQEMTLAGGKVSFDLPKDASLLELWFICVGSNGTDQFDNANPRHIAGFAPNYGFVVDGGSNLLFAGSVGNDASGNSFRLFTKSQGSTDSSGETVVTVDVHVEYSDTKGIFGNAAEGVFGVNAKTITGDGEGHVSGTACDARQISDNERRGLDFVGTDPALCVQGKMRRANGLFAGDTRVITLHGNHVDEQRQLTSLDVFFTANGVFDSANGANYTVRLDSPPSAP